MWNIRPNSTKVGLDIFNTGTKLNTPDHLISKDHKCDYILLSLSIKLYFLVYFSWPLSFDLHLRFQILHI